RVRRQRVAGARGVRSGLPLAALTRISSRRPCGPMIDEKVGHSMSLDAQTKIVDRAPGAAAAAPTAELSMRCGSCRVLGRPILCASAAHGLELQCRFCGVRSAIAAEPERPVRRIADGC